MADWSEIRQELEKIGGRPDRCDVLRRKKLVDLQNYTKRNTVLYIADFLNRQKARIADVGIDLSDKDGFMEVLQGLSGSKLDIILHSPGGSAEATESIVEILRNKFDDIRFIIPSTAKSAATMLALSGDLIVGYESSTELGPTDPQMIVNRDGQAIISPAQAVKEQFEMAKKEVKKDTESLTAWIPILRLYGPSLLVECDHSTKLSEVLVATWLEKYMLKDERTKKTKAKAIAHYLATRKNFRSHSRRVSLKDLERRGVKVLYLSSDKTLEDLVTSLYHSITITFSDTGAYKIFENHEGKALIRSLQPIQIPIPQPAN